MTPSRLPANVRVAPNSPKLRANDNTAPDASPGRTSGRVTRRRTVVGFAPRVAATASYRFPADLKAPSKLTTRKGRATKVCARTTAVVENAIWTPAISSDFPSRP
ncbi:hypothetical protein PJL18_03649 [Paenarthrobacter nicotinovorans]|nr:hypothetical protein [Paenarthrobacter nicotinovorans]